MIGAKEYCKRVSSWAERKAENKGGNKDWMNSEKRPPEKSQRKPLNESQRKPLNELRNACGNHNAPSPAYCLAPGGFGAARCRFRDSRRSRISASSRVAGQP